MADALENHEGTVSIGGRAVSNLRFADDINGLAGNEGSKPEVLSRIAQTTGAMAKLKPLWNDKNISLGSKIKLMRTLAISIFLYAYETWTLTADLERRIQALELRCLRNILNISYKDHGTNEEVRTRVKQAIGPYDDLQTTARQRKLR
ncbi:uncharacterized protein [Amphiura filiformis]|uniref:uncharacterized protein n=1 Tax=Amphiura filiformis TaxID=82378 RepID=UPI003B21ACA9